MAVTISLTNKAWAIERVVIIAPAAADIFYQLGADDSVVGVTNSVAEFPQATKVGTHLNPGVETIASLKPTLVVCSSRFDPALVERMGAEYFLYEPKTLEAIVDDIRLLADKIDHSEEGKILADSLAQVLADLREPKHRPTVLYETRSTPVALAKNNSIIKDLLERAGMRYAYPHTTGMVSSEYLMTNQPEYYMYQEGPMNIRPVQPVKRSGWAGLRSCVWKVNEFEFARANTKLFATVKELNDVLNSEAVCERGKERFPE